MARKLREALGMVNTHSDPVPEIKVPEADKSAALVEAAESGFAAIQALYADRNKSVELAQSLHRHNVYLMNINNTLRGELAHARQERDHLLRSNARLGAYLTQARDLFQRIGGDVAQVTETVEHMQPPPSANNNPEVPDLTTLGLPVEAESEPMPQRPSFDQHGRPINGGAPPVDVEQLRQFLSQPQ